MTTLPLISLLVFAVPPASQNAAHPKRQPGGAVVESARPGLTSADVDAIAALYSTLTIRLQIETAQANANLRRCTEAFRELRIQRPELASSSSIAQRVELDEARQRVRSLRQDGFDGLRPRLGLQAESIGDFGAFMARRHDDGPRLYVIQIMGADRLLVRPLAHAADVPPTYILRMPTAGLTDDTIINVPAGRWYRIAGTESFTTINGAGRTVFVLEEIPGAYLAICEDLRRNRTSLAALRAGAR